jgi:transcriptional regulator with XRE-family HTH domain
MKIKNAVGEKVENIRLLRSFTKSELAERSGMTEDMINLIESGNELPSLAPLVKISRALGVRLGTFLDDNEIPGPVVTRNDSLKKGVNFSGGSPGSNNHMNFLPLARDKSGRHMEPFIVEIQPSDTNEYALSSHEGEEFLYVLEGEIEIFYGNEKYLLSKGESIYYDSIVKHNVHSGSGNPATVIAVVYAPF